MKYSLKSSFSRLILALFAMVLLLTIVGRIVTVTGAWAYCVGWPVCVPTEPLGYLNSHILRWWVWLPFLWHWCGARRGANSVTKICFCH